MRKVATIPLFLQTILGFSLLAQTVTTATPSFNQSLQALASRAPNPCDATPIEATDDGFAVERQAIDQAGEIFKERLNTGTSAALSGSAVLAASIKQLERASSTINASWPAESRFHARVQEDGNLLVVTMTLRSNDRVLVLGKPDAKRRGDVERWQRIDFYSSLIRDDVPWTEANVFPLRRGPSHQPRFLIQYRYGGCAGSSGIAYVAWQWDGSDFLTNAIEQDGAFGMDSRADDQKPTTADPFAAIGKLKTDGKRITLPYCTFTPLDWWDNPSLCAEDTYDVSSDKVQFVSRRYNRPELAPIASALHYAAQHDYFAVRAYCTNDRVARELVRALPSTEHAEDPSVKPIGPGRKRVLFVDSGTWFDVVRRGDRWVISSVHVG